MSSFRQGLFGALRALASPEGALPLALGLLCCALSAWLERNFVEPNALDRALWRDSFGLWLPLCAFAVVKRVSGGARLEAATRGTARHAGRRRATLMGACAAILAVLACAGLCFALATVLVARPDGQRGLLNELLLSGWIGAFAGVAYGAWLSFASGFGRRGRRLTFLGLDLIFGSSVGAWALPFPRAHIRNLLGGAPPLGLPQLASTGLILAAIALILAVTAVRVPE
ncbi:MAG: hypothetical protein QM756_29365 [Polyangiaceae bacterium]